MEPVSSPVVGSSRAGAFSSFLDFRRSTPAAETSDSASACSAWPACSACSEAWGLPDGSTGPSSGCPGFLSTWKMD